MTLNLKPGTSGSEMLTPTVVSGLSRCIKWIKKKTAFVLNTLERSNISTTSVSGFFPQNLSPFYDTELIWEMLAF